MVDGEMRAVRMAAMGKTRHDPRMSAEVQSTRAPSARCGVRNAVCRSIAPASGIGIPAWHRRGWHPSSGSLRACRRIGGDRDGRRRRHGRGGGLRPRCEASGSHRTNSRRRAGGPIGVLASRHRRSVFLTNPDANLPAVKMPATRPASMRQRGCGGSARWTAVAAIAAWPKATAIWLRSVTTSPIA